MPRVIRNEYFAADIPDATVLLISNDADVCLKVVFDTKYLNEVIQHKWVYNTRTNQVTSAVPRVDVKGSTRILLQHLLSKLEWPEKIFKHVSMEHPHDFRIAKMRPKFHIVTEPLNIGLKM